MEQRADIALVMLDVDGTLLDTPQNRQLPAQTGPVLGRVMERGVQVGLASGRNYAHLMSQMGHLGLNGPMVCNNGASVLYQEALLYSSTLDADALRFAFQLAKELKCLVEYSSVHDIFIYQAPGYEGPAFAAADKGPYLILLSGDAASFARVLDTPVAKITFGVDTREKAAYIREALEQWNQTAPQPVTISASFWFAIEVTAQDVSKGRGLQMALQQCGISPEAVLAIGDGDNDVEMLRAVGASFAMENGSAQAKAAARYLAPSVKENGAVTVLKRYILGEG